MSELLRWGAATDAGRVRDGNEDAFLAEPLVFAVADGMGGHQAGEVASAMAVDVLRQRLTEGAPSVDVVVAAVVVVARKALSWPALLRRLAAVNLFVVGVWLTVPIHWPSLALHDAGIALAWQITLRVNVIALAASLLLARMSGIELARAVTGLGLPASLGALLAQAVRSIALLAETHARLTRAMRARGYRADFGWRSVRVSAQLATSLKGNPSG